MPKIITYGLNQIRSMEMFNHGDEKVSFTDKTIDSSIF